MKNDRLKYDHIAGREHNVSQEAREIEAFLAQNADNPDKVMKLRAGKKVARHNNDKPDKITVTKSGKMIVRVQVIKGAQRIRRTGPVTTVADIQAAKKEEARLRRMEQRRIERARIIAEEDARAAAEIEQS